MLNLQISFSAIGAKLDVRRQLDVVESFGSDIIAHLVDSSRFALSSVGRNCFWKSSHGSAGDFWHQANLLRHSRIE